MTGSLSNMAMVKAFSVAGRLSVTVAVPPTLSHSNSSISSRKCMLPVLVAKIDDAIVED